MRASNLFGNFTSLKSVFFTNLKCMKNVGEPFCGPQKILEFYRLALFISEIHTINEKTPLLGRFIHDLGLRLRSTAVCTHIHRVRYGHFTLHHALLRQQWNLNDILVNIAQCKKLLTPRKLFTNMTVTPQKDIVEDSEDQGAEQMIRNMLKNKQPD